jgi:hypothetical protein
MNTGGLPETLNIADKCPSCGRPNPEFKKRCAYCCALTPPRERISVRSMNLSTIILFIAAIVYFAISVSLSPHYIAIGDLNEAMNFSHVRVLAKVRYISEFKDKYEKRSTIQLELEDAKDGSGDGYEGRIKLKAEGEVARELKEKGLLPARGDIIDASATLFAGKGYRTLSLGTAELLKVLDKSNENKTVDADIKSLLEKPDNFKNKKIKVKEAVVISKRGKLIIEVADAAVEIAPGSKSPTIIVFGVDSARYTKGQKLSINGLFVYYERGGYWEIKVNEEESDAITILN